MKHLIHSILLLSGMAIGSIYLTGCEAEMADFDEQVPPPTSNEGFYPLFEEALQTIFDHSWEEINTRTTFWEMADIFDANSKEFFANKGFDVANIDIHQARSSSTYPTTQYGQPSEKQQKLVDRVLDILQEEQYTTVRQKLSELSTEMAILDTSKENQQMTDYLKYINNILNFLEYNRNKFNMLNILAKYNEFHEIKLTQMNPETRSTTPPMEDGIYPHPSNPFQYLMVMHGDLVVMDCPKGCVFDPDTSMCVSPDQLDKEGSWWQKWGKCIAAILAAAGTEGLGGAGVGSTIPGVGTVAGAIIGILSGALTGAVAGC